MIDRSLSYGRNVIESFLRDAMPYRTVLDCGAGFGDDLALARLVNPEARLIGLEENPEYVAKLRAAGIEVIGFDLERQKIPFEDGSMDVVIANQFLEHIKEIFWIFHEVTRVLRVGGHFIIGVPNLAALHNRILLAAGIQPSPLKNNSAHVRGYTKMDMLRLVESCFSGGYALEGFGGANFYPFPPILARPLASALPNLAWGIFFLFRKVRPYRREFLDFPVAQKLETNFYLGN